MLISVVRVKEMKKAGDRASGIKPTGAQVPATTRQPEGVGTVNTSPPESFRSL